MPFQPGNKLGKGRPGKNTSWAELMRRAITVEDRHRIICKLSQLALAGDSKAAQLLMDRMDGKPNQSLELSGNEDKPLLIGRGVAKTD